jgi:hypothetical protein
VTAPRPAPDTELSERLAAALYKIDYPGGEWADDQWAVGVPYRRTADALLPVVQAIAAEKAAEAIRDAADDVMEQHGTASLAAKRLYARAAALRTDTETRKP